MKIKDKGLKRLVDVCDKNCSTKQCYWPRPDPGIFNQGFGYTKRQGGDRGYICGTREIRGCPDTEPEVGEK